MQQDLLKSNQAIDSAGRTSGVSFHKESSAWTYCAHEPSQSRGPSGSQLCCLVNSKTNSQTGNVDRQQSCDSSIAG